MINPPRIHPLTDRLEMVRQPSGDYAICSSWTGVIVWLFPRAVLEAIGRALALDDLSDLPLFDALMDSEA